MQKTKENNKIKDLKIPPAALIVGGIFLFLMASGWQAREKIISSLITIPPMSSDSYNTTPSPYSQPTNIAIPILNINVQVKPGGYYDNQWVLSDEAVHFVQTSGLPGEGYNTIIYGHNTVEQFANLKNIEPENIIVITDEKGKEFKYQVYAKKTVKADEVNQISSDTPNHLTLFTCDGALDLNRLIIKAKQIEK